MGKIGNYFQEVRKELVEKTSWPSWRDLSNSAVVVMITSIIIALVVFVMDYGFENLLKFVYKALY